MLCRVRMLRIVVTGDWESQGQLAYACIVVVVVLLLLLLNNCLLVLLFNTCELTKLHKTLMNNGRDYRFYQTWENWWIQWTDWVCWRLSLRAKWRLQNGTLSWHQWIMSALVHITSSNSTLPYVILYFGTVMISICVNQTTLCLKKGDPNIIDCNFGKD